MRASVATKGTLVPPRSCDLSLIQPKLNNEVVNFPFSIAIVHTGMGRSHSGMRDVLSWKKLTQKSQPMNKETEKGYQPCKQRRLQYYDEVNRLYYEEHVSLYRLCKDFHLPSSTIYGWIRKFASENHNIEPQMKKTVPPTPEDYAKLQAEVARLQKALKDANMRAEFYDTMIDVAEEMFKIPIRKKAGPKQ